MGPLFFMHIIAESGSIVLVTLPSQSFKPTFYNKIERLTE